MSKIDERAAKLNAAGRGLGVPKGSEQSANFGGIFREYANGNIYWHEVMGRAGGPGHACEVCGAILATYLAQGGPDRNPGTGVRELGFPLSGEVLTEDGLYPTTRFEWGTIVSTRGTTAAVYGDFETHWSADGRGAGPLGYAVGPAVAVAGGRAVYFEGGCLWKGPASDGKLIRVELITPQLGKAALVGTDGVGLTDRFEVRFDAALPVPAAARTADLLVALWTGRLVLESIAPILRPPARTGRPPRPAGLGDLLPHRDTVATAGGAGGSGGGLGTPAPAAAPHVVTLAVRPLPGDEPRATVALPGGALLSDRALYDLLFAPPAGGRAKAVIAAHAVYAKKDWSAFGLAHATDLHLSGRNDRLAAKLANLGFPEGARRFNNFNNNFRDFVRWANDLHDRGELDVVMATGDLVDYVYDNGDEHRPGPGNFRLFEDLVLGRSPYPASGDEPRPAAEELRVPVLTTLGNHDYRANEYHLMFELKAFHAFGVMTVKNYSSFNLTVREAVALVGGHWAKLQTGMSSPGHGGGGAASWGAGTEYADVPNRSPDEAARYVSIDEGVRTGTSYYFRRICRQRSYAMPLGGSRHRLVMLDSGHDVGVVSGMLDAVLTKLGHGSEDQEAFVGGSPNSEGVRQSEVDLVNRALAAAGPDGLVLVGIHAPLVNVVGNEHPYYFRESERPAVDPREVAGFLFRQNLVLRTAAALSSSWKPVIEPLTPRWPLSGTAHFKRGEVGDLTDYGVSRGLGPELLAVCAGRGPSGRPADLVMAGHVHINVELRVRPDGDALAFFHDHYTENPPEFRGCYANEGDRPDGGYRQVRQPVGGPAGELNTTVKVRPAGYAEEWVRHVPPNPRTLAAVNGDPAAAKAWWADRRPVVVQTGPLGPTDSNDRPDRDLRPSDPTDLPAKRPSPTFQGVRLVTVRADAITSVRTVTVPDIRRAVG